MDAATSQNGDGRVSMAVLSTKLDIAIKEISEIKQTLSPVTTWCTESRTRWVQHDKEHADLEREMANRRNIGDVVTGLMAAVAAVLGIATK